MPQLSSAAILSSLRRRFEGEDPDKDWALTSEKVRILYNNLWQPVYAGILGAVLLVSIMWEVVAPAVLISWLVAIIAISLVRLRLASLFLQSDASSQAHPKWIFGFAFTVFVAGCVWGTAGVLMFSPERPEYVAALAIILSGVAATPDKSHKTASGIRPECKTKRKILSSKTHSLLIAVLAAVFFFTFIDPLHNLIDCSRWQIWSRIIHSFPSEPWGQGLGSFKQFFPLLYPDTSMVHVTEAHNEYLQAGFEMGVFAMVLIFAYLISGFYKVWKKRDHLTQNHCQAVAGFTILALSCAGFHVFHIPPLALLGAAWLGQFERFFSETESAFFPLNPAVFNKRILQPSKVAS